MIVSLSFRLPVPPLLAIALLAAMPACSPPSEQPDDAGRGFDAARGDSGVGIPLDSALLPPEDAPAARPDTGVSEGTARCAAGQLPRRQPDRSYACVPA